MSEERPLPSPLGAAVMTLLAFVAVLLGWVAFAPDVGDAFGLAMGLCLGFGGIGTLAARSVPGAEERLGLRGFAPRFVLPMLLFLPSLVLASELDNLVRPLFPALSLPLEGEAAPDPVVLRLAAVEFAIATALLRPVLEEFFFRGVIQQGVVAHLGALGGVAYTAALFGLANGGLELPFGPDRAASAAAQAAFAGLLLGLLRQASGSVLAPMVASCALESFGIASTLLLADALPIPGYNAPGPHTPLAVLAPCAAAVALGAWLATAGRRP